jgi:hypothetical protein
MVSYAKIGYIESIKKLWKEVFGDSDEFLNLYFNQKFQCEHCLVCIDGGALCASLQMLPYTLQLNGASYSACYIFAVMTAPSERNKGHMQELLEFAFKELQQTKISFVFLIPQEPYLFNVYSKFGFKKAFLVDKKELELPETQTNYFEPDTIKAYEFYSEYYKDKNLVVQSYAQFEFIYNTIKLEGGNILAIGENNSIKGLCLCVNTEGRVRALDFLSPDNITSEYLLSAIRSKYNINTVIVSQYNSNVDSHLGMCIILNKQAFTYADTQSIYLSLMMNE